MDFEIACGPDASFNDSFIETRPAFGVSSFDSSGSSSSFVSSSSKARDSTRLTRSSRSSVDHWDADDFDPFDISGRKAARRSRNTLVGSSNNSSRKPSGSSGAGTESSAAKRSGAGSKGKGGSGASGTRSGSGRTKLFADSPDHGPTRSDVFDDARGPAPRRSKLFADSSNSSDNISSSDPFGSASAFGSGTSESSGSTSFAGSSATSTQGFGFGQGETSTPFGTSGSSFPSGQSSLFGSAPQSTGFGQATGSAFGSSSSFFGSGFSNPASSFSQPASGFGRDPFSTSSNGTRNVKWEITSVTEGSPPQNSRYHSISMMERFRDSKSVEELRLEDLAGSNNPAMNEWKGSFGTSTQFPSQSPFSQSGSSLLGQQHASGWSGGLQNQNLSGSGSAMFESSFSGHVQPQFQSQLQPQFQSQLQPQFQSQFQSQTFVPGQFVSAQPGAGLDGRFSYSSNGGQVGGFPITNPSGGFQPSPHANLHASSSFSAANMGPQYGAVGGPLSWGGPGNMVATEPPKAPTTCLMSRETRGPPGSLAAKHGLLPLILQHFPAGIDISKPGRAEFVELAKKAAEAMDDLAVCVQFEKENGPALISRMKFIYTLQVQQTMSQLEDKYRELLSAQEREKSALASANEVHDARSYRDKVQAVFQGTSANASQSGKHSLRPRSGRLRYPVAAHRIGQARRSMRWELYSIGKGLEAKFPSLAKKKAKKEQKFECFADRRVSPLEDEFFGVFFMDEHERKAMVQRRGKKAAARSKLGVHGADVNSAGDSSGDQVATHPQPGQLVCKECGSVTLNGCGHCAKSVLQGKQRNGVGDERQGHGHNLGHGDAGCTHNGPTFDEYNALDCLPVHTREQYYVLPTIAEMSSMTGAELARIEGFTVGKTGVGEIKWPGPVDVRGIVIDDAVQIEYLCVEVNPKIGRAAALGSIPTIVKLCSGPKGSREEFMKTATSLGVRFIDFDELSRTVTMEMRFY